MKPTGEYRKHVYWLAEDEAALLGRELQGEGVRIAVPKGVVCTPLDERNRISIVPPGVWSETCRRQGSWYRASHRNGLFLVVSTFELPSWGQRRASVITKTDFQPPRLASPGDKEEMIRDPGFRQRVPQEWQNVDDTEKRIYLRWARRFGSQTEDYDFLFLSQTANHANFLKPRFFIGSESEAVPYSIDMTAHLCSCCLELFQILGEDFARKLVRPCPGATLFARLKPDQYFLVERP